MYTYGDGGVYGDVTDQDGNIISWTKEGVYCGNPNHWTDPMTQMRQHGSCLYEGDLCSEALTAVNGIIMLMEMMNTCLHTVEGVFFSS